MKNVKEKLLPKVRLALLAAPLSALLLACASDGREAEGGTIVYRYPPDSLLVVAPDPVPPTLEELTGPNGDQYTGQYIKALELSGMTRRQAIQCVAEWKRVQMAIDAGQTPANAPAYCVFTPQEREGGR